MIFFDQEIYKSKRPIFADFRITKESNNLKTDRRKISRFFDMTIGIRI